MSICAHSHHISGSLATQRPFLMLQQVFKIGFPFLKSTEKVC